MSRYDSIQRLTPAENWCKHEPPRNSYLKLSIKHRWQQMLNESNLKMRSYHLNLLTYFLQEFTIEIPPIHAVPLRLKLCYWLTKVKAFVDLSLSLIALAISIKCFYNCDFHVSFSKRFLWSCIWQIRFILRIGPANVRSINQEQVCFGEYFS